MAGTQKIEGLMPWERICTKCGRVKDLTEFNLRRKHETPRRATCAECDRKQKRKAK